MMACCVFDKLILINEVIISVNRVALITVS